MSARNVCRGTRPSRYHSERAISAPPKRPLTSTLIPLAPKRIAFCTAFFIARRNITRRSNCEAILSATNFASNSGFFTSAILICAGTPAIFATALRNFSTSSPFLPITIPGRAV